MIDFFIGASDSCRIPVCFLGLKNEFSPHEYPCFQTQKPKRGIEVRQTLQSKVHGGGHGRLQKRSEMFGGRETIAKSLPPPK